MLLRLRAPLLAAALATSSLGLAGCDQLNPSGRSDGSPASLKRGEVDLLLEALKEAPSHGFQPGMFAEQGVEARLESNGRAGRQALHAAVIAYARALHGHSIPAKSFETAWGLKPAAYDAEAEFRTAASAGRLEEWVKSLPPPSPRYEAMRAAYAQYGRLRAGGGWAPLPVTAELRAGARGPAVTALRARLALEDATLAEAPKGDVFDATLVEAVKRAQLRYGLYVTGVVDADTRKALDVPVDARLAQIRANLERLRWLPRDLPATRVEANTAAGQVDVYREGQPVMTMLAAAGKPGDESPILVSAIDRVVLNPTWNVPEGIAQEEILPKGEGYLQRMGFISEGERLVQQPGPQNALGRVKFLFDNNYSVYLHDTPAKAAFTREQRSVSHGCVRLERALELAQLLLSTEPGWSAQRMNEVLASGETREVKLSRPVPVTLGYFTAFPTDVGIAFRPDVYGWDAAVLRRLDAARPGSA
jgi:murein L,D-transpeptidase YcbB/YkuD